MNENLDVKSILEWYICAGVDTICANDISLMQTISESTEKSNVNVVETSTHLAVKSADNICDNIKNLDDLRCAIENFDGCALKVHASHTVFGSGNPSAKVMFVGEAPGADEDRIGTPFVGKCGKLLDKMLEAINLNRKDCFISNILPWRPPGNRNPTTGEVAVCLPFIKKQIDLVSPDFLVLLGGSSANAILDNAEPISRLRGKWMEYKTSQGKTVQTIATFHPSFLLRNSSQKAKSWSDFLRLSKKIYEN